MKRLDRDRKLLEQVKSGRLDPKVAAAQVHSPVLAKKLRGRARHLRRHARPSPARAMAPSKNPGPSPRFARHIALTVAKPRPVARNVGTGPLTADVLRQELPLEPLR